MKSDKRVHLVSVPGIGQPWLYVQTGGGEAVEQPCGKESGGCR